MTTVTYTGGGGAITHTPPSSGTRYTFHRNQPVKVTNPDDIVYYRMKEERGSPFRVEPKPMAKVLKEIIKTPKKGRKQKKTTPRKKAAVGIPSRTNTPKSDIFI